MPPPLKFGDIPLPLVRIGLGDIPPNLRSRKVLISRVLALKRLTYKIPLVRAPDESEDRTEVN